MSEPKAKLGKRPCPLCAEPVHVRANSAGTLSIACPECDFSGFAKKGTLAASKLTAGFEAAPEPAPAKKPAATTSPPPATRPGFSLGQL